MKRSKINSEIRHMEELIQEHGFEIPPFCKWTVGYCKEILYNCG